MFNKFKSLVLPAVITAFCASAAGATTISVQSFGYTEFGTATTGGVVENFENLTTTAATFEGGGQNSNGSGSPLFGELTAGSSLSTSVGAFTTTGGTGSGSTCRHLSVGNNTCSNIAVQYDPEVNGQGNIVPLNGDWSLNAADTTGIEWTASLAGGGLFQRIVFALRDAADQRDTTLTVATIGGGTWSSTGRLANNNQQLFVVDFGTAISSATITIANANGRVNDSFTLDGAAIVPSPVPLPAGAVLLLTGLGGLAIARRRRATA